MKRNSVAIIAQHTNGIGILEKKCVDSFKRIFPPEEYDYYAYKIEREEGETFCQTLLKICLELHNYEQIGLCFDDLYFLPAEKVSSERVKYLFEKHNLDYVRFNAYPPGDRISEFNSEFSIIERGSPYMFSLVASFFRRELLEKICSEENINTAWDIEKYTITDNVKAISRNSKKFKYYNLVVKGAIDGLAIQRSPLSLKLKTSIKFLILEYILNLCHKNSFMFSLLKIYQNRKRQQ